MPWKIEWTGADDIYDDPTLGFDSSGEAHIGYRDDSNHLRYIWRDGGTWTAPVTIATVEDDSTYAFAAKGNALCFAWTIPSTNDMLGFLQLWIATAEPGGSWTSTKIYEWEETVYTAPWYQYYNNTGIGVDLDSEGHSHVLTLTVDFAWNVLAPNPYSQLQYFVDDGAPITIDSYTYDHVWWKSNVPITYARPVFVDGGDVIHTIYKRDNADYAELVYANSATSWTPVVLAQDPKAYGYPTLYFDMFPLSVAANADGDACVLYVIEEPQFTRTVYYAESPGWTGEAAPAPTSSRGLQKLDVTKMGIKASGSPQYINYYSRNGASWDSEHVTFATSWTPFDADLCFHPTTGQPWIAFDGIGPGTGYGVYVAYPGSVPSWWFMI